MKNKFYWEEDPKGKSIRIEVPGYNKNEIKVGIEGGMLIVSAEKKSHKKEKGKGFYKEEASFSSFHKSMSMPESVTGRDFDVSITDGKVELKKKKKAVR
ncbi:MAG: Hsp20/alpha crystallin family protein [Candidatus Aenigmarchaeota archaeon]|nr:Hsp20/alpha crystallin family protein [Candidatus Aenigmarchaeota archaeon]